MGALKWSYVCAEGNLRTFESFDSQFILLVYIIVVATPFVYITRL